MGETSFTRMQSMLLHLDSVRDPGGLLSVLRDVKAGNILLGEDGSVQIAGVCLEITLNVSLIFAK